ncbi:MAG: choice-of-anchor H family protein [Gammaproteobacteria bacterium]|nr:choice-of-anchor H family protein [Gammaproteobacteria bacterium]
MNFSRSGTGRHIQFMIALILAISTNNIALAEDSAQMVRSTAGFKSDRGTADRHDPATLQDYDVKAKSTPARSEKQSSVGAQNLNCCPYRIYSARTQLFDDLDLDGFYTYLRVSMDIDTDYFDAQLFVQVYLRGEIGNWFRVFDSEVFTIYGNSGLDDYEVETELLSGFPPDYYDVLIEVYDAYTGELVLEYGPAESPALSLLAMEDVILDNRSLPRAALSSGGGGSLSIALLGLLLCLAARRSGIAPARHL